MKILHISDTHAEGETLSRLESLVQGLTDCDVVACTGDNSSKYTVQVPDSWNEWPQRLKLMVPGNHLDTLETYRPLTRWTTMPPWWLSDGDLGFVGLCCYEGVEQQFEVLAPAFRTEISAVVVLAHYWLEGVHGEQLAEKLRKYFNNRPVLYLHGHNHPLGAHWDSEARVGDLPCYRSNIISSIRGQRAHLITWDGRVFSCQKKP